MAHRVSEREEKKEKTLRPYPPNFQKVFYQLKFIQVTHCDTKKLRLWNVQNVASIYIPFGIEDKLAETAQVARFQMNHRKNSAGVIKLYVWGWIRETRQT